MERIEKHLALLPSPDQVRSVVDLFYIGMDAFAPCTHKPTVLKELEEFYTTVRWERVAAVSGMRTKIVSEDNIPDIAFLAFLFSLVSTVTEHLTSQEVVATGLCSEEKDVSVIDFNFLNQSRSPLSLNSLNTFLFLFISISTRPCRNSIMELR